MYGCADIRFRAFSYSHAWLYSFAAIPTMIQTNVHPSTLCTYVLVTHIAHRIAPQETQAQESLSLDSFGMGMETAAAPMSHDQPLSLPEVNSSLLNEWESKHTQKLQVL